VERGEGGEAGLVAQVRDTDCGLYELGVLWVKFVNGSWDWVLDELKNDKGELNSPAEAGGPSA